MAQQLLACWISSFGHPLGTGHQFTPPARPVLSCPVLTWCGLAAPPQVVVQEMRQLVANPELQAQIIDFAKQACSVFPSFQPTCEADVDQYAPMVFGMALAYLQPEQVRGVLGTLRGLIC